MGDNWSAGDVYENYMGRWSRPLALAFVKWLNASPGAHWLEVGCGTGALTDAICTLAEPDSVLAYDPSESFVMHARKGLKDTRVSFAVGSVESLPAPKSPVDWLVSGLVLNFLPDPFSSIATMRGLVRPGGTVAAYVWDYAQGMQFLRLFWDAAIEIDAAAASYDEGVRFPICSPGNLRTLFSEGSLGNIVIDPLMIATTFKDFDDLWLPFTRGTGPAPSYAASLSESKRTRLRNRLLSRLRVAPDGTIPLKARAWAVKGTTAELKSATPP